MNTEEKEQVRVLRTSGYSYKKIAEIMNMKRSTVVAFCLRNDIRAPDEVEMNKILKLPGYRICRECKGLFLADNKASQEFCSSRCRDKYWEREREEKLQKELETERKRTLQKELDFLEEESDEWCGDKATMLCCRKESI